MRPPPGERVVEDAADRAHVGFRAVRGIHAGVREDDPAVVADERRARMHVAVHHPGRVHRRQGIGDRVRDRGGPARIQRALLGHQLAQRLAVDPLAHHIRPLALVDSVVDADQVRVDDPARVHRGLQHLGRRLAARVTEHDRDRPAQDHVDAAPHLPAGTVVVDVFLEPITLGQDLTDGGGTEGHDRPGIIGRGLVALADLGHQSSLGAARACRH
jgi:hypothetical protein